MTSTLSSGTLTVKVIESIKLNGVEQGANNTKVYTGINSISKRIITITTAESVIATFSAAVASAGHYVAANVRYMRFTNKDDTNFITLTFRNQDNDEAAIKLDAGQSFIWNADNSGGLVDVLNATEDADAASDTALGDLTNLQADANTASCDLEMLIASV
tara:strand:- start:116 stop:595 length:480 start_codon:yes stop_codon:yes gene_type:complete